MEKSRLNVRWKAIFVISIAVILIVFSVLIAGYLSEIDDLREQLEQKQQEYEELSEENEELQIKYNESDETSYYEDAAHEQGYVYPDEYVYADAS